MDPRRASPWVSLRSLAVADLAGRTAALFGARTPILVGVLSLACYGWYYRPLIVRWNEQRRSRR